MDNASKALIMVGGVFISMAIIGVAVATYSHAQDLAKANEEAMSTSQIESFNRFYTAYRTTYSGPSSIRCVDAVNILNRAIEDEVEVSNSSAYIVDNGGYYTADPADYTTKTVKYTIKTINGIGVVNKVIITD